jgi:hypothetical protein
MHPQQLCLGCSYRLAKKAPTRAIRVYLGRTNIVQMTIDTELATDGLMGYRQNEARHEQTEGSPIAAQCPIRTRAVRAAGTSWAARI